VTVPDPVDRADFRKYSIAAWFILKMSASQKTGFLYVKRKQGIHQRIFVIMERI